MHPTDHLPRARITGKPSFRFRLNGTRIGKNPLLWLTIVGLVAVGLAIYGAVGSRIGLPTERVVFVNDWLPGGDKALPFFAVQKGLFAQEGLDVSIQSAGGSSMAIRLIRSGAADMGSGGLAALLQARAQDSVPVKAVLNVFPMQPDALFTIEGSNITSLKEVEGRTVATATFSSSNVIWPLILKANGVDESKVKLLKVDPEALVQMLVSGKVDAVIAWTTSSPLFIKELALSKRSLKIILWAEYGLDGYGYSIFAADRLIAQKPEVVRKFVRAFLRGIDMALHDPRDVAQSMKVLFPEMGEDILEQQFKTIIPLIDNAISKAEGRGLFDPARVQKTWEWTAGAQNISIDSTDPQKAIDRSFIPK